MGTNQRKISENSHVQSGRKREQFCWAVRSEVDCGPGQLQKVDDTCMFKLNGLMGFCAANKQCADRGERFGQHWFLVGKNAHKIPSSLSAGQSIWTSRTRYFDPSPYGHVWRVGDPHWANYSETTSNASAPSPSLEEGSAIRITYVQHNGSHNIFHLTRNSKEFRAAVCERVLVTTPYHPSSNMMITTEVFRVNWPSSSHSMVLDDSLSVGCYANHRAPTIIDCAFTCRLSTLCRTAYYNPSKRCVLSLYVDSLLPMIIYSREGNWTRLARPNCELSSATLAELVGQMTMGSIRQGVTHKKTVSFGR
ncbi:hypothetical protein CSKR_110642 [Clonorchis sinensis]|uniref:Apple domain-containing protein n=1 Tax=Clonorchis sinensis TaxID=79923 RepID=A0A8T1MRN7_CLOSI|nr:hypothetical protein CSKR_110642 [Clonorchis sinensis]